MDFSNGVFAFFMNDFLYPESKIGDFKLCFDSISGDFISQNNPELRYSKEIIVEDPHFLIFKEHMIRDENGKFVSEVGPYEMLLT